MCPQGSFNRTAATFLAVSVFGAAVVGLVSKEQTGTHSVTVQLPRARLAQPGFAVSPSSSWF
jgi:hypothetical protein